MRKWKAKELIGWKIFTLTGFEGIDGNPEGSNKCLFPQTVY